jgi:hypothetical protein
MTSNLGDESSRNKDFWDQDTLYFGQNVVYVKQLLSQSFQDGKDFV